MRAVVMRAGAMAIEDVPEPTPGPGQILVAPYATGICGSDLHFREESLAAAAATPDEPQPPVIPGHEIAGEVIALGPDVPAGSAAPVKPGDLVTAIPFTMGAEGPETIGLSPTHGGGLAELMAVDAVRTMVLPEGLDLRLAALAEPVAVAAHAAAMAAPDGPIVVVGAGPIGLGIIAVNASAGRGPIIAVDPSPSRRDKALAVGATSVHEPGTPLIELMMAHGYTPSTISPLLLDKDPNPSTVFECVGRAPVVQAIVAEAPPHSQVVLAGACPHTIQVEPLQLTVTEVKLAASFAYRHHDFATALRLLSQEPERFGRLITGERPLEEAEAAFDDLAGQPDEVKILIRP
ncbi:MAG: alcohol dehydrogenase catalytic domain-containing protein [Acidimicrobiales bacterium]